MQCAIERERLSCGQARRRSASMGSALAAAATRVRVRPPPWGTAFRTICTPITPSCAKRRGPTILESDLQTPGPARGRIAVAPPVRARWRLLRESDSRTRNGLASSHCSVRHIRHGRRRVRLGHLPDARQRHSASRSLGGDARARLTVAAEHPPPTGRDAGLRRP